MELKVDGMMCHGCEMRIEKALKNLGAHSVKADRTSGTVCYVEEIDKSKVVEAIEDLGFDVDA